jgi:hypothetical protein
MIRIFFLILIPYFSYGLSSDQIEELLRDTNPTLLNQSSFDSGTLRIKAGGIYKLCENIAFNPLYEFELTRTDKPVSGWFALITVETEQPVIIDLNGYTICSSSEYDAKHLFNVFALIELGNSPFSGKLFGFPNPYQAFVNFKGDLNYTSASQVIIKNGLLGRSGHWGIHGNNNSDIYITDLVIKDWEVRAIELNGLRGGSIKNVEIAGLEHHIQTSVQLAGALQIKERLELLAKQGFKDAYTYLYRLDSWLHEHPDFTCPQNHFPTGTIGGIFITSGGVSNAGFPVTTSGCLYAQNLTGGRIATDIILENIFIHDLVVNSEQKVALGSKESGPDGNIIRVEYTGILPGGSLLWHDAYNEYGEFDPNPILKATVFVMQAAIQHNPLIKKKLPPNFDLIAQSILSKNHLLFLSNAQPVYTYPSHKVKGLFGIRLDGVSNVAVTNCRVFNISNIGEPVLELHQLPDGNHYTQGIYNYQEYRGCDIWGFECASSQNCIFNNCIAERIVSCNGNPFGFELIVDTQNILIQYCQAIDIKAYGDIIFSKLNLPSEAYGFRVQDTAAKNVIRGCVAENIQAPRRSFGFAAERAVDTEFDHCVAQEIEVSSGKNSLEKEKQKVAFGFSAEGSLRTSIKKCDARNILNSNLKNEYDGSIIAGFAFLENDASSLIHNNTAENLNNAHGASYVIYVDEESDKPFYDY